MRWLGVCFYVLLPLAMGACGNLLDRQDAQDPSNGSSGFVDAYKRGGTLAGNGGSKTPAQFELQTGVEGNFFVCKVVMPKSASTDLDFDFVLRVTFFGELWKAGTPWAILAESFGQEIRYDIAQCPEAGALRCEAFLRQDDGSYLPIGQSTPNILWGKVHDKDDSDGKDGIDVSVD